MSKKILVADDSVVIQKSIGITFAQEDFEVTFVGNGEEALQRAKEVKPDLILADTSMPKLSGAELCRRFRQEPEFKKTPIMLLASSQEAFTLAQLKVFGANDFIQKPFESAQLLNKVRPLLTEPIMPEAVQSEPAPVIDSFSKNIQEQDTIASYTAPAKPKFEGPSMEFEPIVTNPQLKKSPSIPLSSADTRPNLDVLNMDMGGDEDEDSGDFAPLESFEPPPQSTKVLPKETKKESARPAPSPSTPAGAPVSQLQLSEQQIEQIVAKVFQSVIERIAWEVVPEIAERMIKEEIAKITEDRSS